MASVLEEFAYGNICPQAQYYKKGFQYGQAVELISRSKQKLLERLGADDKKVFEAYVDMQDEVNRLTAVNNLIYGYKLGVTMTAEAFLTSGDLLATDEEY